MELRVLKYFLMTAREENITKAATLLHITQPTLSRQLMQLEEELGVKLFHRSRHRIVLTDDGMLLKRRAQEIVSLAEKTEGEFLRKEDTLSGEIAIGSGETCNMMYLSKMIASFREKYPLVQYSIYSAIADDVKDRIERGILDMGMLTEPVDIGKYEFIRMPRKERWGVLMRKDSELAAKGYVQPEDLVGTPLLMVKRDIVKNQLENWFGDYYEKLEVAGTYNLILNAAMMVRSQIGMALCFDLDTGYDDLCFVPFYPKMETGSVLAWKRHQAFSPATTKFIEHVKECQRGISDHVI